MGVIASSLALLVAPDQLTELRFLSVGVRKRTHAGWIYGRDIAKYEKTIEVLANDAEGAYFTPNPVSDTVLSRAKYAWFANVVRKKNVMTPKLTGDADIVARRWVLIDIDPIRPAGVSATDGEKSTAWAVAKLARGTLADCCWPTPIVVDSGNGYHLYYDATDMLDGTQTLGHGAGYVATLLKVMASVLDGDAKIDTTVCNPARIMKIPGTWAKKGENTTERPWRQSKVVEVYTQ